MPTRTSTRCDGKNQYKVTVFIFRIIFIDIKSYEISSSHLIAVVAPLSNIQSVKWKLRYGDSEGPVDKSKF